MPRLGVLPVIAGLLIASGIVRLSGSAGQALAEEPVAPMPLAELQCSQDTAPEALIAALQLRETEVIARERQVAARAEDLRRAEEEIVLQLATLEEAEVSLAAMLQIADGAAETDLAQLTAVYENMPPEDVATMFEEMVPEFSAGFLARMAPEAAAAVMTNLDPNTAYSISVVIASRHSDMPTQ